jgi:hypothetical protein
MKNRTVWIHVHIPKSGGSTVESILKKNFRKGFVRNGSLLDNYHYSKEQIEQIINIYQNITCLSDHKASTNLPFEMEDVDIFAITSIRNPVDHFLSGYFYNRNPNRPNFDPLTRELTLDEYITKLSLPENRNDFFFHQFCRGAGLGLEASINNFKTLINQEKLIVLPLDKFDEACVVLERQFPEYFRDCSYTILNKSKRDQSVSEQQYEQIREFFALDIECLDFIHTNLEQRLQKLFKSESDFKESLENFRTRCQAKTLSLVNSNKPESLVKKVKRKVKEKLLEILK